MQWLQIAYLVVLVVLGIKLQDAARLRSLRSAWKAFALIPFWQCLMYLGRMGATSRAREMHELELWSLAVPSLLLGISLWLLTGAIAPRKPEAPPQIGAS